MSQKRQPIKMETPTDWLKMIENIRLVRKMYPAPVDTMGCDQAHSRTDKTQDQRFQVLLSLMLSSQTKDPITWAATQKLKEAGLGRPHTLMLAKEKDIEDLIYPVGFYRRKAVHLRLAAEQIATEFGGDIPRSVEALCTIKGVGPKMAHLCMQEAWNVNSGIGVDTHVHRISARLGWVPKDTKTPEHTREALESWMPRDYWREINHLLVGFGQTICTPLRPQCGNCANNEICPSSSVKRGGTKSESKQQKQPKQQQQQRNKKRTKIEQERPAVGEPNEADQVAIKIETPPAAAPVAVREPKIKLEPGFEAPPEPELEAQARPTTRSSKRAKKEPVEVARPTDLVDTSKKRIKKEKVEL